MGSHVPTRAGARTNLGLLLLLVAAFLTGWLAFAFGAALAAVPLAIWHVAARRIRVRGADLSRRSFLRGAVVLSGAAAAYGAGELAVRAGRLPGGNRRFTGSYEAGSYTPALMPVSSWMFDAIPKIDVDMWRLKVGDRELRHDELSAYDDRMVATLDCTGGFYSTQAWAGARLDRLIAGMPGNSIRVVSHSGYDRR